MSGTDVGRHGGAAPASTGTDPRGIRVALPTHLRTLAGVGPEVRVTLSPEVAPSQRALFDALEAAHPRLRGTIRDHDTGRRRAYMRYFVGREDWSHESPDTELPESVVRGEQPFRVLGAIAGG